MSARCSTCGKPVVWAELGHARPVVLDAKPEKRFTLHPRADDPEAVAVDTYQRHRCAKKGKAA